MKIEVMRPFHRFPAIGYDPELLYIINFDAEDGSERVNAEVGGALKKALDRFRKIAAQAILMTVGSVIRFLPAVASGSH
jgi:hypothetical protein